MPHRARAPKAPAIATARTVRMRCIVVAEGPSAGLLPQVSNHEVRYPSPVLDPSFTPGALTSGSVHPMGGSMVGWLAQEGGTIEAVFGSSEKIALWIILGISIVALLFAWYLVREVLSAPEGTLKMREIAQAIQEGAKAYLSRQFRTVAVFLGVLTVALFFLLPAPANAAHSAFSIKFGRS